MTYQEIEGTWEEVLTHAEELAGHHVRLTVLDPEGIQVAQDTDIDEETKMKAFQTIMSPLPGVPILSDEAISRESIYAERG